MFGAKSNRICGEMGNWVSGYNPLSISAAASFPDLLVSNFSFERKLFGNSLFCSNGLNWKLKEADVNPRCSECPAYFNIWLFDISTIVLIIFTTIVCIFTSVFNAMRQLLGQSHCPGLPMGLPIPQINCPLLARCSLARSLAGRMLAGNVLDAITTQLTKISN